MQGLPTLKAFGQSGAYGRMLADKARALSDSTFLVLGTSILTRGITDLGCAFGAAAALALGAYRVRYGEMSLEALLIVLMAGTEIFRPLRELRTVLHQGLTGQAAAAGINALLDEPVTAPGAPSPTMNSLSREAGEGWGGGAAIAPSIAFDAVGFAYPGGRRAAHHGLTFSIAAGERVGIVGPSGSGKSTIVRLLLRLHDPQSGTVRIGGQDLRTLDPGAVRRMIAVVAQDTYLFHGTIEDNLRLGCPDASEADLAAAARAANAHDFIEALPDGYQTVIGERGARLSGGQRQRIAIARALLRDAPILVLDEALSSVDAENEAVIQQALDRLMTGRTTLILAHRLSSVINADRILVLNDGAVADSGRHAELIARDGPYRRLMGPQLAERGDAVAPLDELAAPQRRRAGGGHHGCRARPRAGCRRGRLARDHSRAAGLHPSVAATACDHGVLRHRPRRRLHRRRRARRADHRRGAGERAVAAACRAAARRGAGDRAAALARIVPGARHGVPPAGGDARRSVPQAGRAGAGLSAASAAPAIWSRWRHRTSRRSNISMPIPLRRRSSRC